MDLVNDQNPDTKAITGDFVSYILDEVLEDLERALKRLKPKDVVVASWEIMITGWEQ